MLKNIFLLFITIVFFSGCHRYHHNVRTIISPTIIFKPFHFNSSYHHNYRGHYPSYHKRGRAH